MRRNKSNNGYTEILHRNFNLLRNIKDNLNKWRDILGLRSQKCNCRERNPRIQLWGVSMFRDHGEKKERLRGERKCDFGALQANQSKY